MLQSNVVSCDESTKPENNQKSARTQAVIAGMKKAIIIFLPLVVGVLCHGERTYPDPCDVWVRIECDISANEALVQR